MKHLLLVAAGGAIGSSLRHLVNMASLRWFGPNFPWGTLAVNVLGCFAMGVLIELIARRFGASQEMRLFIATGILGGFTTFSAFSGEVLAYLYSSQVGRAAAYVTLSVTLAVAATLVGFTIARATS
jgi:CrcB protein